MLPAKSAPTAPPFYAIILPLIITFFFSFSCILFFFSAWTKFFLFSPASKHSPSSCSKQTLIPPRKTDHFSLIPLSFFFFLLPLIPLSSSLVNLISSPIPLSPLCLLKVGSILSPPQPPLSALFDCICFFFYPSLSLSLSFYPPRPLTPARLSLSFLSLSLSFSPH